MERILQKKVKIFFVCFFVFFYVPIFAQTHISVPLQNQIYSILELAETRGLCSPLSGVRPYSQDVVNFAIKEIIYSQNAQNLSSIEREVLEQYLQKFSKPDIGLDWHRGAYYNETAIGGNNAAASLNMGIGLDTEVSAGLYSSGKNFFGTEIWIQVYLNGDLSHNVSYNFSVDGGLIQAPRRYLGEYWTYYENFKDDGEYQNRKISVYSEPLTHFPYSYKKRWDSSVFFFDNLAYYDPWPTNAAGGYNLLSEITASFLENKLKMRLGRLSREWGSTSLGSGLAFNQMARPFLGIEAEFNPVSWFSAASLTGVLEYYNLEDIKISSLTFQNAFSITILQFRYKNYLFFDFTDAVIWPKRFELGYISPVTNSFFYQNNIGDFDNMAMSFNLKVQYPGLGNAWISLFMDEMNFTTDLLTLDRQMFSWQTGMSFPLPILSFSSIKLSYTWISPYCYTHNRNYNPWYGNLPMETAYTNNGVSLGYYLPPNSDEILIRFSTMPVKNITTNLQYQMIRHGADFGSSAVDGSNLLSELDPNERDTKPELKRFFLQDGAYQWQHILKFGGEWTLEKTPLVFYWEVGTVISYFTNTAQPANSGKAYPYSTINTPEYPQTTGFVAKLGFRLFPR
jgi:hypothetical protein